MQSTSTKKAAAAFIACVSSSLALAHAFTNHAGHVVCGELTSVSGNVAVVSGRRLPLSAFPPGEQARMRALVGATPPPTPRQREFRRYLDERLKRIDALEKAGAVPPDEAARHRAAIRRAIEKAAKPTRSER